MRQLTHRLTQNRHQRQPIFKHVSVSYFREVAYIIPDTAGSLPIYCQRLIKCSQIRYEVKRTFSQALTQGAGDNFFAVCRVVHEMLVALHTDVIIVCGRHSPY